MSETSRDALIDAAQSRATLSARDTAAELKERDDIESKRIFRRMIYSGIERNNDKKLALESIRTLYKLARNILDHPGEEKYCQFKTTNSTIKRLLIDPKDTLEYAVAMGFRADIQNFQPLYVFRTLPKAQDALRNGSDCLKEYIDKEDSVLSSSKSSKESRKQIEERQKALVRLAYEDDRKEKRRRDEMEKERREALAALAAQKQLESMPDPKEDREGSGDEHSSSPTYSILPINTTVIGESSEVAGEAPLPHR